MGCEDTVRGVPRGCGVGEARRGGAHGLAFENTC